MLYKVRAHPCLGCVVAVVVCAVGVIGGASSERVHGHQGGPFIAVEVGGVAVLGQVLFCQPFPVVALREVYDPVAEGEVVVREVGHFCRPIVHFDIDVGMDVAVPHLRVMGPDALKVGRSVHALAVLDRTRGGYHEVAAIVEHHVLMLSGLSLAHCTCGIGL